MLANKVLRIIKNSNVKDYEACLLKTDELGNMLWLKEFGNEDTDFAYSVQQTTDEGFIFCGGLSKQDSDRDVLLVKTDNNGNVKTQFF